jgi:hypothetical protein
VFAQTNIVIPERRNEAIKYGAAGISNIIKLYGDSSSIKFLSRVLNIPTEAGQSVRTLPSQFWQLLEESGRVAENPSDDNIAQLNTTVEKIKKGAAAAAVLATPINPVTSTAAAAGAFGAFGVPIVSRTADQVGEVGSELAGEVKSKFRKARKKVNDPRARRGVGIAQTHQRQQQKQERKKKAKKVAKRVVDGVIDLTKGGAGRPGKRRTLRKSSRKKSSTHPGNRTLRKKSKRRKSTRRNSRKTTVRRKSRRLSRKSKRLSRKLKK